MRIYISGPITGTNDFMERFKEVEDRLTGEGMSVINPAHANSYMPKDTTYEEYMKVSFCLLDMCEGIYMMAGWRQSSGVKREYAYAVERNMMIMFENEDEKEEQNDGKLEFCSILDSACPYEHGCSVCRLKNIYEMAYEQSQKRIERINEET